MPVKFASDVQRFETWGDFLAYVSEPSKAVYLKGEHSEYGKHPDGTPDYSKTIKRPSTSQESSSYTGDYRFTGTNNYAEALTLATEGWKAGQDRAAKILNSLFDKIAVTIEKPELLYDVEGESIDIATYLDGDPECWTHTETFKEAGTGFKLIRIVFNCSVSGAISKEIIEAKGASIAALIQLLEFAGHRVELTVLPISCTGSLDYRRSERITEYYAAVKVKEFDQPLELSRLMFAMAHPSSLRRLGFLCMEKTSKACQEAMGYCYGYPADLPKGEMESDLYFGSSLLGEPSWTDEASTQQWILNTLKAQGVRIKD